MRYQDYLNYQKLIKNNIKNPRLFENENILEIFEVLGETILGPENNEYVMVMECFTTEVFPRNIYCSQQNIVLWDNHFWDIYGRFLYMYFAYLKAGNYIPKQFFSNYYESMMLAYLANRMEGKPALAKYIAEEYSKLEIKYPTYDIQEDIEELLSEIGHIQEYNMAKLFAFCHEIAHIAYNKDNNFMQKVKKEVLNYSQFVILLKEARQLIGEDSESDSERVSSKEAKEALNLMYDCAVRLTSDNEKVILEEVCCDVGAMLSIYSYFEDIGTFQQDDIKMSLSSIRYFYHCMNWLLENEKFWNGLYEVYTDYIDDAFVNPNSPYFRLGEKISDEYKVRQNFVFDICSNWFEMGLEHTFSMVVSQIYNSGFSSLLSDEAIGANYLDGVLFRVQISDKDYESLMADYKRKNELLGWESTSLVDALDDKSDIIVEPAIQYVLEKIPSLRIAYQNSSYGLEKSELWKNQCEEALLRLDLLEEYYGINPNIKKYFSEGRLYYSYITGPYIGTIDTIRYHKHYEEIVRYFEEENSALVYHAIEHKNTLSLLFVSDSSDDWEYERPTREWIQAWVWDFENDTYKLGFIKVDVLEGALYRRNSRVYENVYQKKDRGIKNSISQEIVNRLTILKKQGLETDIDVVNLFINENELFYSELMDVFGYDVGVVQRLSDNGFYSSIVERLERELPLIPYFILVADIDGEKEMAVLFLSSDESNWKDERDALNNMNPVAIVIDLTTMRATVKKITYSFRHGGPVCESKQSPVHVTSAGLNIRRLINIFGETKWFKRFLRKPLD